MKKLTAKTLIDDINNWRSLTVTNTNLTPSESIKATITTLYNIRDACNHKVYVHLSTDYKDDGFCDPDFYSSYKCLRCGSDAYSVPSYRDEPDTLCINVSNYAADRRYSDEEKFAIVEFRFRQLVRDHPEYDVETIVKILNEEFAKK